MSIQNFLAEVKTDGLMRNTRFSVWFALPAIFGNKGLPGAENIRKILLFCESANLPGISLSTSQARTFGEFREVPWEKLFQNITLSFYIDNSMQIKEMFDNWILNIQDPNTRSFSYYNDYITDLTIKVGDSSNKSRYAVTLYECYPQSIAPIQMSLSGRDIIKLDVTFAYKNWVSVADNTSLDDPPPTPPQPPVEEINNFANTTSAVDQVGYTGPVAPDYRGGYAGEPTFQGGGGYDPNAGFTDTYRGPVAPDYSGGYIPGPTAPSGGGFDPNTGVNQSDSANSIGGAAAIT
jgi:hypothetical protein